MKVYSITIKGTSYQNDVDKFNNTYTFKRYRGALLGFCQHYKINKLLLMPEKDSNGRNHVHGTLLSYHDEPLMSIMKWYRAMKMKVHVHVKTIKSYGDHYRWTKYCKKQQDE